MRLLLIEDDTGLGNRLKTALGRAGYTVDLTADGIDGQFLGSEGLYDAVILDLGLPGRTGLEILRNGRDSGDPVPVIGLTARDAWHERVDGFNAGADDYLGKPFHEQELLARIGALIRRSQTGTNDTTLRVAGLELDEHTQAVRQQEGDWQSLTATEFRLLRCFMLQPGRVLSKQALADRIYDLDSDKDSNVLEVYINRLRRKLGDGRITTRRGQGYVFGEPGR